MSVEVLEEREATEQLTRRRASAAEFWSLPETNLPTEYVKGEIVVAPSPTYRHQSAIRSIFRALDGFEGLRETGTLSFAPLDVVLPGGDVVQPDIFLLAAKDAARAAEEDRVSAAPLLVVEILSPGTVMHDTVTKRELYEKSRVREYWIVDLEKRAIAQLVLRKKHYAATELCEEDTIKSVVVSGFKMKVGRLLGL